MELKDTNNILNRSINNISLVLNKVLPNTDNILDYNNYLKYILKYVRQAKWVPVSLYDEKKDLEQRIERSKASYVRGDSFGDGMPLPQLDPASEERKHIERLELEERLAAVIKKIDMLNTKGDNDIKDCIKELLEVVPNEKHQDIMKQYYIYRKSNDTIADDTNYSVETVKVYRKRGFNALVDILFNFSKKTH